MTGLRVGDLSSNTSTVNKLTIFFLRRGSTLDFSSVKQGRKVLYRLQKYMGKERENNSIVLTFVLCITDFLQSYTFCFVYSDS